MNSHGSFVTFSHILHFFFSGFFLLPASALPPAPVADTAVYACVGATSIELTANADIAATDSLLTTMAGGNGSSANMFVIEAIQETTIESFAVNMYAGATGDVSILAKFQQGNKQTNRPIGIQEIQHYSKLVYEHYKNASEKNFEK